MLKTRVSRLVGWFLVLVWAGGAASSEQQECDCPALFIIHLGHAVVHGNDWNVESPPAGSTGELTMKTFMQVEAQGLAASATWSLAVKLKAGAGGEITFPCPDATSTSAVDVECAKPKLSVVDFGKPVACKLTAKKLAEILQEAGGLDGAAYDFSLELSFVWSGEAVGLNPFCGVEFDEDSKQATETLKFFRGKDSVLFTAGKPKIPK